MLKSLLSLFSRIFELALVLRAWRGGCGSKTLESRLARFKPMSLAQSISVVVHVGR